MVWACPRHAHAVSPEFASEFSKFGALARTDLFWRRRFEPKIYLASACSIFGFFSFFFLRSLLTDFPSMLRGALKKKNENKLKITSLNFLFYVT